MDQNDLYKQYDFSQSWDSAQNSTLLKRMPEAYRCPNAAGVNAGKTSFLAVIAKEAAWGEYGARSKSDFEDGLKDTIMLLELPYRAVPWTKPEDFVFSASEGGGDGASPKRKHIVNALFTDGSVYGLDQSLFRCSLRSAFTRSAGDAVNRHLLKKAREHNDTK